MYELLHISKYSGLQEDYHKYKTYLNNLTHLKCKARNKFYRENSKLYGQDKSKTWRLVNEIINFKRKTTTNIKSIIDKKKVTS